jgi:predicted small metal-binding protein
MGAPCSWSTTAETGDELKKKIWEHAETAHKDLLVSMSEMDKEKLEARIDALIDMQGG